MAYSLSFSKGLLVVIFIADKIRQEQFEYLSTQSISDILNIPKPTLVKILQNLSSHGIIETKEGKTGGIRLKKDISTLTVYDVLISLESGKSLFNTSFDIAAQGDRPEKAMMVVNDLFQKAEQNMYAVLAHKTIQQILFEMN